MLRIVSSYDKYIRLWGRGDATESGLEFYPEVFEKLTFGIEGCRTVRQELQIWSALVAEVPFAHSCTL